MTKQVRFSESVADAICEQLIEGRSLRSICAQDGMPSASTVCRWLAESEPFREQYAHAREAQADTLADEVLHIADTQEVGEKRVQKQSGVEVTTGDMVEHRRLRVDARKWYAAKLCPRKYSEKFQHGGDPDGSPMQIVASWLPSG